MLLELKGSCFIGQIYVCVPSSGIWWKHKTQYLSFKFQVVLLQLFHLIFLHMIRYDKNEVKLFRAVTWLMKIFLLPSINLDFSSTLPQLHKPVLQFTTQTGGQRETRGCVLQTAYVHFNIYSLCVPPGLFNGIEQRSVSLSLRYCACRGVAKFLVDQTNFFLISTFMFKIKWSFCIS